MCKIHALNLFLGSHWSIRLKKENHSLKSDSPEMLSLNCLGVQFHILGKIDANIYSNSMQMC